jgi:hypothetical protein
MTALVSKIMSGEPIPVAVVAEPQDVEQDKEEDMAAGECDGSCKTCTCGKDKRGRRMLIKAMEALDAKDD